MEAVTINWLRDIYWMVGVVLALGIYLIRLGYKLKTYSIRIERLEWHDELHRADIAKIVLADFAILEALVSEGHNGNVKKARDELQRHISMNRYTWQDFAPGRSNIKE